MLMYWPSRLNSAANFGDERILSSLSFREDILASFSRQGWRQTNLRIHVAIISQSIISRRLNVNRTKLPISLATPGDEWAKNGVFARLLQRILVRFDSPLWCVELRPVDLRLLSANISVRLKPCHLQQGEHPKRPDGRNIRYSLDQ
ncbi:hypothetical protein KC360_g85 [Hortaea werneckii]|nr:hypothetical protein KC344_g82 [Hortaea werneckii]KAI7180428.1 hypothetical protein KC360_g85 [Hortaea werneckii]